MRRFTTPLTCAAALFSMALGQVAAHAATVAYSVNIVGVQKIDIDLKVSHIISPFITRYQGSFEAPGFFSVDYDFEHNSDPHFRNWHGVPFDFYGGGVYEISLVGTITGQPKPQLFGGINIELDNPTATTVLQSTTGSPLYAAQLDGRTVQTLIDSDLRLDASNPSASANFAPFMTSTPGTDSIGIKVAFSINEPARVIIDASFFAVPEPSSAALLGLGGFLLARRRRG